MPRLNIEEIPEREFTGKYAVNRPDPVFCLRSCLTIVLDLDETLIRTFNPGERIPVDRDHPDYFSFYIGKDLYEGVKRPWLDNFLNKICKMAGRLIVFTASKPSYAKKIVEIIFASCGRDPDYVFTYDHCVKYKNMLKKPIDEVFNMFSGEIDAKRLIIIDDKESVYFSKDIKNVAQIKAFIGQQEDRHLEKAYYLIKTLWNKENVRRCEICRFLI